MVKNRLTFLENVPHVKGIRAKIKCVCSCGKKVIIRKDAFNISTFSCGCYHSDKVSQVIKIRNTSHNMSKTRFYNIWKGIKKRCTYEKLFIYKYYGGRGIKCEWSCFEDFKKDMLFSYKIHVINFGEKQTTIDRINNSGNYCKENCRWATMKEQCRNKRTRNSFGILV